MDPVRIALDVGPLHGHRTGIGVAVAELAAALDAPRRRRGAAVRAQLPQPPGAADPPATAAGRPRPPPVVARSTTPVSTTGSATPRSSTAPTTSLRRAVCRRWSRCTTAGSSTTGRRRRRPCAAPATCCARRVRPAPPSTRPARRRPTRVRDLLGTDRVEVVHLGPLAVRPRRRPRRRRLDARRPPVRPRRRDGRAAEEPARRSCARSPRRAPRGRRLVIAGAPGDDAAAVDAAVDALDSGIARRNGRTARCRSAIPPRPGCCTTPVCSLIHRSTRGSASRCSRRSAIGLPIVATRAGSIPEVAGDGAELVAARRQRRARRRARPASSADERRRAELVAAGRANVARFSWSATADAMVGSTERLATRRTVTVAVLVRWGRCSTVPPRAARRRRPRRRRGDRQHRRRHRAARAVDLARPRHDHLHPRRRDRPGARLGPGGETWQAMAALARYEAVRPAGSGAAATWFNLGDATWRPTCIARRGGPRARRRRTSPTRSARAWGLGLRLLPMTDGTPADDDRAGDRARRCSFQDYFVRLRHDCPGPRRSLHVADGATPTTGGDRPRSSGRP